MAIDWRKLLGLKERDQGVLDEHGIPVCGCGHSKNYHMSVTCFFKWPSCECVRFIQAKQ